MKNNKQKSLVKSARKQAINDIKLRLVTDLSEAADKLGAGSQKLAKEIKKGSKKLAKKVTKEIKFEVAAVAEKVKAEKAPKAAKKSKVKADPDQTSVPVAPKAKAAAPKKVEASKPKEETVESDAQNGRTLPD